MHKPTLFLVTSLSLVAFGCSDQPEPQTAASHSTADHGGTSPGAGNPQNQDDASSISLSERLRKLCNIDAAYFAFDSSNLDGKSQGALDQLAECFTKGAAKGKRMALVGHADERGEETYNMGLGQRRAGSVAVFLKMRGVPQDHMETSSRGEIDATGKDHAGWARDRRVDIDLAGE
jgi:peptidoglycan-associated lipoprotein